MVAAVRASGGPPPPDPVLVAALDAADPEAGGRPSDPEGRPSDPEGFAAKKALARAR
jgi:hypothetical protein